MGLVALALLAVGEAAPAAWPVAVTLDVRGNDVTLTVDGATHEFTALTGATWRGIRLDQPGPLQREYQVDGSDTTATNDLQPLVIRDLIGTPLYQFDAWLRDEPSFSRWEHVRIVDAATGQPVPSTTVESDGPTGHRTEIQFDPTTAPPVPGPPQAGGAAADAIRSTVLPQTIVSQGAFTVQASLRRPEAAARLWLLSTAPGQQEGLELDRDARNARWLVLRGSVGDQPFPRWFFPEQPLPFVADLLHLLGRATAAGYALVLAAIGAAALARTAAPRPPPLSITRDRHPNRHAEPADRHGDGHTRHSFLRVAIAHLDLGLVVLALWFLAALAVSVRVYHQLPHILDAVSYTFQAGTLGSGRWWLTPPALVAAFRGPFQVIDHGHWFSQYPPGAPVAYALGGLVGLSWVVGPLACASLIGATSWTAGALYGRNTGRAVLILGVLSPFVLFQSGSLLSHPIAGGLLALALASFVRAEQTQRVRWYAASGAFLGAGFLTREAASVLFALPLIARAVATRRWEGLGWLIAFGLPCLVLYVAYNTALTGSPTVLPRSLFDASDRFGFGDSIGFHRRHTLAAGLVNTDELLTLLQFDLFGWPPLFALGLLLAPFLIARPKPWDLVVGGGALAFVLAYVAYFYHGIALGPRYYFEALPWMLILAGRGAQRIAHAAGRKRQHWPDASSAIPNAAVSLVLGALCLNTIFFYLPAELSRRRDFSGFPDARPLTLAFVRAGIFGPHLDNVPTPALVLTDDWWTFNTALASLNCPRLPDCPVLFALATTRADEERLAETYPGRTILHAVAHGSRIDLEPGGGPT